LLHCAREKSSVFLVPFERADMVEAPPVLVHFSSWPLKALKEDAVDFN